MYVFIYILIYGKTLHYNNNNRLGGRGLGCDILISKKIYVY